MLIITDIGKFAFYVEEDDKVVYSPSTHRLNSGFEVPAYSFFMMVEYIHTEE